MRSAVSGVFARLQDRHVATVDEMVRVPDSAPLGVPTTAVYTRTDGVVRWWQCIESVGPQRENIEVRGSHLGLAHNPAVLWLLADRLGMPETAWRPFRPPLTLRPFFPGRR